MVLAIIEFDFPQEYPVVGYVPPAILTELRFDLRRCTFDIFHKTPAGKLTLALGRVNVHCNLLETGRDVSIGLTVEDAAAFASVDADNFLTTSICFCDLDFLDLNVSLMDEPKPSEIHFCVLFESSLASQIFMVTFVRNLKGIGHTLSTCCHSEILVQEVLFSDMVKQWLLENLKINTKQTWLSCLV